jgi:hypothetical protein
MWIENCGILYNTISSLHLSTESSAYSNLQAKWYILEMEGNIY